MFKDNFETDFKEELRIAITKSLNNYPRIKVSLQELKKYMEDVWNLMLQEDERELENSD